MCVHTYRNTHNVKKLHLGLVPSALTPVNGLTVHWAGDTSLRQSANHVLHYELSFIHYSYVTVVCWGRLGRPEYLRHFQTLWIGCETRQIAVCIFMRNHPIKFKSNQDWFKAHIPEHWDKGNKQGCIQHVFSQQLMQQPLSGPRFLMELLVLKGKSCWQHWGNQGYSNIQTCLQLTCSSVYLCINLPLCV